MKLSRVTSTNLVSLGVFLVGLLLFPYLASAQVGHCTQCKTDTAVNGCLKCTGVSGYGYCSCTAVGKCPQLVTECGDCSDPIQVRLNCSDCCPGCSCIDAAKPFKTALWARDSSIPEQLQPFSAVVALAVEELQTNAPACRTRHPIIKVLDQETHTRVLKFDTYINDHGVIELEGNGEKFIAGDETWELRRDGVRIISGEVHTQN